MAVAIQRQTQMDDQFFYYFPSTESQLVFGAPTSQNLEPIASGSGRLNPKKMGSGKGGRKYSLHPPSGSRFCDREPVLPNKKKELGSRWFNVHAFACTIGSVLWFRCYHTLTFSRSKRFGGETHHQVVLNLSSTCTVSAPGEEVLDSVCEH